MVLGSNPFLKSYCIHLTCKCFEALARVGHCWHITQINPAQVTDPVTYLNVHGKKCWFRLLERELVCIICWWLWPTLCDSNYFAVNRLFALKYAADAACTVLRVDQVISHWLMIQDLLSSEISCLELTVEPLVADWLFQFEW